MSISGSIISKTVSVTTMGYTQISLCKKCLEEVYTLYDPQYNLTLKCRKCGNPDSISVSKSELIEIIRNRKIEEIFL